MVGGGAPQRGHSASLKPLAQRNDALWGGSKLVFIFIDVVPTNTVATEPGHSTTAVSTGADTKANMWGGGAPEVGDLRLLEDGSDCGGALGFDFGATETAGEVQSEDGERAVVSRGTDAKASHLGCGCQQRSRWC